MVFNKIIFTTNLVLRGFWSRQNWLFQNGFKIFFCIPSHLTNKSKNTKIYLQNFFSPNYPEEGQKLTKLEILFFSILQVFIKFSEQIELDELFLFIQQLVLLECHYVNQFKLDFGTPRVRMVCMTSRKMLKNKFIKFYFILKTWMNIKILEQIFTLEKKKFLSSAFKKKKFCEPLGY